MKLIKLTDDRYVVVNETIQPVNGYYYDAFINKIKSTNGAEYGEASHCWQITHSTEPLEHGTEPFADGVQYVKIYYKIKPISLQEVKELIGVVDKTEWEVEWETIDNRQPCNCSCHNNPNMIHFVACCNNGWIGKVTQKLKLK